MKKILSLLCAVCALILTFSCTKEEPVSLKVSSSELNWEWNATDAQTVAVNANYEWTASVSDEAHWVLTPAADGKSFAIAPQAENTAVNVSLTATVTVTCREVSQTIQLSQAGA
ncbi:MAG: BACON domain-containing protein, partial [Bacteroidales bacterium]|nr:BACON domain-containing protein [Bacteroidales bacterium]